MTDRMAAMVGCDGGKPSARAATGDHDQRCRNPPPAGSQGCRPVIEPGPSGGRSGCFADVGLALITLARCASLAVQGKPGQKPMAERGQPSAAASAERPRPAAQAGFVNLRDESGTFGNQTGAMVRNGVLAALQHVVPAAGGGDAILREVAPSPSWRGSAGMADAATGLSLSPVRRSVAAARLWARNVWSARLNCKSGSVLVPRPVGFITTRTSSGPPGSYPIQIGTVAGVASSSASSSSSACDKGRPRAATGDANGRRQKPTLWQSGHTQSSQKSPPPADTLDHPVYIGFSEPAGDFAGVAAKLFGDLPVGPVLCVEADGQALETSGINRLGDRPEQAGDQSRGCKRTCHADKLEAHHAEARPSGCGRTTRTSWRSGRVSRTGHCPADIRSSLMATSADALSLPFSMSETWARERRPI